VWPFKTSDWGRLINCQIGNEFRQTRGVLLLHVGPAFCRFWELRRWDSCQNSIMKYVRWWGTI
jgi:hypothetical protein